MTDAAKPYRDMTSAFPYMPSSSSFDNVPQPSEGMTLRDYFAARAMMALISNDYPFNEVPAHSYAIADVMMAERRK